MPVARWLASACWLAFFFAGMPSAALAAAGRVTVISAGIPRTAILVQHSRLKQARRAAIIILRGGREKGGRLKRTFSLEELARSSGAVLVYPEPLSGQFEAGPGPEAARDSAFIHDLIAKLLVRGIADREKVFLVGFRTGGMLALRSACEGNDALAGVAVFGASLPADLEASCRPLRPTPLLIVASAADPMIPFHGGTATLPHGKVEVLSVGATLGLFGKAAGCQGGMTTSVLPEREAHHGGIRAHLDKLDNCSTPVEAIRIEGAGHALPGLAGEAGASHGFAAGDAAGAKLVWDFFSPLGG